MLEPRARWVLAFDASCGACREISSAIAQACEGSLEVLPLTQPDVERWREQALGPDAPWAPTLLRIGPCGARAWTGPAMGVHLVRRMGFRSTINVFRSLGELNLKDRGYAAKNNDGRAGLPRVQFLRLGVGAVVAGGLVLTGRAPAFGSQVGAEVESWLAANKHSLPVRYDDVVAYSMPYRRAIFGASPASVKSALWVEQLKRYRSSHPGLTEEQAEVVKQATALFAEPSTFAGEENPSAETHGRLEQLREVAINSFGRGEAYSLIATLGRSEVLLGACGCSTKSGWCQSSCISCCPSSGNRNSPCTAECASSAPCCCMWNPSGCGTGWDYSCNGLCYG